MNTYIELLALLHEARELMPLGTKKRADWLRRATECEMRAIPQILDMKANYVLTQLTKHSQKIITRKSR
jgi:hypothetical protein